MGHVLTVGEVLERVGLRLTGGSLKSPCRVSTGGNVGLDDDLALLAYVEGTEGYQRARPALVHVYCDGQSVGNFRLRRPGETRHAALIRLGWFCYIDRRPGQEAGAALEEFERTLADRLVNDPFLPPNVLGESEETLGDVRRSLRCWVA